MQDRNIHSGEIYFHNLRTGAKCVNGSNGLWTDRPAVVISNDDYNQGSHVLATFLTRKADEEASGYYKRISPKQVTIECGGSPATVLCSLVFKVSKKDLDSKKGAATQGELLRIINEVKRAELDPDYFDSLYQPGAPDNDFQIE